MNSKEHTTPIGIYWDIGPSPSLSYPDYRRIAGEIAAIKPLILQITETAPALCGPCLAVLESFNDAAIALSLVVPFSALDGPLGELLHPVPVKVLYVQVASPDDLGRAAELAGDFDEKTSVGVSFPVTRENLCELPRLLSTCIDGRIPHLLLPMQRLMSGSPCFTFTADERKALTAELDAVKKPTWLRITIHDPFLWRAFYPEVEFPNGGCQAANAMLYISPDALVYPCPTVPIAIGDLRKEALSDVLSSDRKRKLRKELLSVAPPCADCAELVACKGGCRGRSYAVHGSLLNPDPACR